MFKLLVSMVVIISIQFPSLALAGCWVDQGALCSPEKNNLVILIMALERKDKAKAFQMINQGDVKTCRKAAAKVIKKEKIRNEVVVHADVTGMGKVWLRHRNLHCQ